MAFLQGPPKQLLIGVSGSRLNPGIVRGPDPAIRSISGKVDYVKSAC
jgi:hypothetical protein